MVPHPVSRPRDRRPQRHRLRGALAAAVAGAFTVLGGPAPVARGADGPAPGAPGQIANWTEGDKDGFGTATALASKVWFTLDDGELTEVYYGPRTRGSAERRLV